MDDMVMTRRLLLLSGATLAASRCVEALAFRDAVLLTAGEVIERLKKGTGIPWNADTVDKIVAGGEGTRVRGVAVTMMATADVLQRAVAGGMNMVITHEPTFYSHLETREALLADPTFQFKTRLIDEHDVVVFRFHDHWHRMKPDGIAEGMTRELGWMKNVKPGDPFRFEFRETPLGEFAAAMATRLEAHSMRVVGDPKLPVRRVAANWGYGSLMPNLLKVVEDPEVDLMIVGETREWELVEYVQDQIASGAKKALIVLNHVVSEQAGMKYCAEWLRPLVPEVPVMFVATKEPFWVPQAAR